MLKSKNRLFLKYLSKRTTPINFDSKDLANFQHEFESEIAEVNLFEYKNVYVTWDGVVINNLKIQECSLINNSWKTEFGFKYILYHLFKKNIQKLSSNEKYTIINSPWTQGFFHFLCDALPRLVCIEDLDNHILLLPESHKSYDDLIRNYFSLKDVIYFDYETVFKVPNLSIVNHTASPGNYNNIIINKLRNVFLSKRKLESPFEYVYISRKNARGRRIKNENIFEKELLNLGFKVINAEDLDREETLNLFSKTKLLVSIHGAGLTNMLWMQPNTSVLEIRTPNDITNLCYFTLASELSIDYYYMFSSKDVSESTDYNIDKDKLLNIIRSIIN